MTKKEEQETKAKLKRLSKSIGSLESIKKEKKNKPIKENKATFKTSEVVVLLLITTIVSLIMGATVMYKLGLGVTGSKLDDQLQEFIKNYNYITENYNGDIDKEQLLDAALEAILNKLDKNSTYLESNTNSNMDKYLEGSYTGVGLQVYTNSDNEIIVYSVFKNSSAEKAGIKSGDKIAKINGKSASNMTSKQFAKKVTNSKNKTIKITYSRNNEEKTVTLKKTTIDLTSVVSKTYIKENKKIGYIAVTIFANNTYKQFKQQLEKLEKKDIDSLIIDLRSNSGGYLYSAENMTSLFLNSNHVIYQIQKDDINTKVYSKGNKTKKYKIIILTDTSTASASEMMTSALKEQYGATIVGETTYGKGTVQEMNTLADGNKYKLTTKNWLTSKGKWIDGKGITPDIAISLNDKYYNDPTEENDNQLQTALAESVK